MNTCQDCVYFRSTHLADYCNLTGEPTFPGNFICGEFEPPEDEEKEHRIKMWKGMVGDDIINEREEE